MLGLRTALLGTIGFALGIGVGCTNRPEAAAPSAISEPPIQAQPTPPEPMAESTTRVTPSDPGQSASAPPLLTPPDSAAGAPMGTTAEAQMTDEQILAVLDATNTKETEEAQIAQTKAKSKEVKDFAKMMLQRHVDAKAKQSKVVQKLGIAAVDTDKSKQIQDETKASVEQLKSVEGSSFDQQFIALMIKDHQTTLDLVDRKLLPMTKRAELKALIENELRPTVEEHLRKAEALAQKLGATGASTQQLGGAQKGGEQSLGAKTAPAMK